MYSGQKFIWVEEEKGIEKAFLCVFKNYGKILAGACWLVGSCDRDGRWLMITHVPIPGIWKNVTDGSWDFTAESPRIPPQQASEYEFTHYMGFYADKFRLVIAKKRATPEGDYLVALKDIDVFRPQEIISSVLTSRATFIMPPISNVNTWAGTSLASIIDGAPTGAYWEGDPAVTQGFITFRWLNMVRLGRIIIYWKNAPYHFMIETLNPKDRFNSGWTVAYEDMNNQATRTIVVLFREMEQLRVRVLGSTTNMRIYEVRMWEAESAMASVRYGL